MTKDSLSGGAGGGGGGGPPPPPPVPMRLSPRSRAPAQLSPGGGGGGGPSSAVSPSSPAFHLLHEDHRRELEALRAELEAERLRAQEARRRYALEARELREAAERERQLLAYQLRSKWEQQRARELHRLREASLKQREAEIRQLLRWKEAELREAQELLQRERDAAMRQARDLQRQLAEELVSRGWQQQRGAGGGLGVGGDYRAKLQEVLGKLRWEIDGDQAARIRHLQAELELERSLFLKYILERFEGEQRWPVSDGGHRARQAGWQPQQQRPGRSSRPRSLESLILASSSESGAASKSRSLENNLSLRESPVEQEPLRKVRSPRSSEGPEQQRQWAQRAFEKGSCLDNGAKQDMGVDSPQEGHLSSWGSASEASSPQAAVQQGSQQQDWLTGSNYNQLMKENAELFNSLLDLEQRYTHLKEENALLRRSSFSEVKDKVKRLKRKNAELALIAKRLEYRAKKLQESSCTVGPSPIPLALTCSDVDLYKTALALQQAKELSEQTNVMLAKDQQLETVQKECWALQTKLSSGKETTSLLDISDFDRLLRESQREVLRLQRQITMKNLRESFQSSPMDSNGGSSITMQETSLTMDAYFDDSSLAKETQNALVKDEDSLAVPRGNGAKNYENKNLKDSDGEYNLLEKELTEKLKHCETLKHEADEKQKRFEELKIQLNELLSENARIAEENAQLNRKNEWAENIESENSKLKIKLIKATDDQNSAVQLTKRLKLNVEKLEQIIKNMKETAERQQQLETEHERTLLILQKKEEEIQQLHDLQTEIKREHDETVQLLEAQVRELENQYHSQAKHFNLLSQEFGQLQITKSELLESELLHTTCNSMRMLCPTKWELDNFSTLHCSRGITDVDSASTASVGLIRKAKKLESHSNLCGSESIQKGSDPCPNIGKDTACEMEELKADKISVNIQPEHKGPSKLCVFLARYSYDPFNGPNKNPEAELPLTAGEYVYIYGEMDEDGFYEGELMDGRRGMVPSNLVEEVSGNDFISFLPSEPSDISYNEYREMNFPSQSASSGEKSDSPDEEICVSLPSNRLEGEICDAQTVVPYPQNLTLIKQFANCIIIGWDPPRMLDSSVKVQGYNIYVNADLCQNVKHGSQMKTVIENLDLKLQTYRVSVQSMTERGNSDKMQCTFLVGNHFHIAPTHLTLQNITTTSAKITWLPSNSNYTHTVYLNEKEYGVTKAGVYWYTFQMLRPSTQYSVKVGVLDHKEVLIVPRKNLESIAVTFTTAAAELPHAPIDVQVQLAPSADFVVISWLPVTIDAAGSSNGVKISGYSIYINGQKVMEIMSPTAGTVSVEMSRLHMFQGPRMVSVRTVSPVGESEDSVPALIPSTLLETSSSLLPRCVSASQASEVAFQEFLESKSGHIPPTNCTFSSTFSDMCVANADTDFTIHFTSNCKEAAIPVPMNISQNHISSSDSATFITSHNKGQGDSILQISVAEQSSMQSFPSSASVTPVVLQVFAEDSERKRPEEYSQSEKTVAKNHPENSKLKESVMTQCTNATTKDSFSQSTFEDCGTSCFTCSSSSEFSFNSAEFELRNGSYKDAKIYKTSLQEAPGTSSENKQMKQVKQLCKELSNLSTSKVKTEEQISTTKSWQNLLGDLSHNSELSDAEEGKDQGNRMHMSDQENSVLQKRPVSPVKLAENKIITMTVRTDQTVPASVFDSGSQRSLVSEGPFSDDAARLFVALFDYNPITMSPNSDAAEEELPFKEGQILKVIGDKDADGFYKGEYEGRKGYIPCNMVSEVHFENKEVKEQLISKGYIKDQN